MSQSHFLVQKIGSITVSLSPIGTVSYNVTGWLDKNRDPINDTVVDLLKKTKTCALMNEIFSDHPGQTKEEEDLPVPGHRRGKKRVVVKSKTAAKMANFKTVCSYFKDQLVQHEN